MDFYFFRKIDEPYIEEFKEVALHHNIRISRVFAAVVAVISLALYIMDVYTGSGKVLLYPAEYSSAISFLLASSTACVALFYACRWLPADKQPCAYRIMGYAYAVIILIASLWITFVMQHNPSNTMSVFVLGMLTVGALWIFEERWAVGLTVLILLLFNLGLHYFQTDPCKLFANYIMGTCVAVFFLLVSRVTFSINYNHFKQIKKIAQSSEDISKVNSMQTEILAVVAHDLHAPINNVITIVDLLKKQDTTEEERAEFYDMILTTCKRSDVIIDDLLSVAKKEERDPTFNETNMNAFVGDMVHYFIHAKEATVNFVYNHPSQPIFALVNKAKLMRVFENLISNAIKFTTHDGIINIDLTSNRHTITITIRDNGIGIPKEMLPELFSRFSKAGRKGLNGEKSYGLGLSICKLIMTQHHGDITATSSEGQGTTMTLTLPAL